MAGAFEDLDPGETAEWLEALDAVVATDGPARAQDLLQRVIAVRGRQDAVVGSGGALTMGRPDGLTKLLVDPDSRRILGVGIVGTGAGELLAEVVRAMEMGADAEDVALSVHPHPTLSETVGIAAQVGLGVATDLPRAPKRSRLPEPAQ